jgi:hypothetical protein
VGLRRLFAEAAERAAWGSKREVVPVQPVPDGWSREARYWLAVDRRRLHCARVAQFVALVLARGWTG